jgi:hypothetical protein
LVHGLVKSSHSVSTFALAPKGVAPQLENAGSQGAIFGRQLAEIKPHKVSKCAMGCGCRFFAIEHGPTLDLSDCCVSVCVFSMSRAMA